LNIVSDKVLQSQDQTGTALDQAETDRDISRTILSVFSEYSSMLEPYQ
jgi:hypothetical protein